MWIWLSYEAASDVCHTLITDPESHQHADTTYHRAKRSEVSYVGDRTRPVS
jgi:hypothetical protein